MHCFNRFLFGLTPIGAKVLVGTDAVMIKAHFGGVLGGILILTHAQVFSNVDTPVDGILNVVRIPINKITFFAQL
jgi:hypothetical protein